ncbi:DUF3849 domain-containing protein [Anaerotruncus sp.]|jgi:hypothetical protein|uniref:DUF3849 domain-containing protein n=1 Tax=Anaerotruncus TaxID=244127 RepID=UPI0021704FC6|nr:DUF3849 domain-containing protein [Anaerotruncus sp.]MCI8493925.1 DUF3849 domain-containing protein [Anaerotruncus sp.]
MRGDFPYLYPHSLRDAKQRGELDLWRESHQENIACKEAIESAIRRDFDGMYLKEGCANGIIEQYGFKRVAWVLSNTLQQKDWDGRFSPSNKKWAFKTYIPRSVERDRTTDYVVESHSAILDGFVSQYHKAVQELNLFGAEHCEPDSFTKLDYEGKVLVLSPDILRESCWGQKNQLWLALDGFGCSPTARGRSVRCTCLGDGEETRWNRAEFVGVLKEEHLPDWARENLEQLRSQEVQPPQLSM